MRQIWFVGGAALAAVLAVIVWQELPGSPPTPPPSVNLPMPPEAAPPPDSSDAVGTRIADRHDLDPPETNKVPLLPNRVVAVLPAHVVPENEPLPPDRPIEIRNPPSAPAQAVTSGPPQQAAPSAAPRAPAVQIAGAAEASGAAALLVRGQPIRLFGVRPPSTIDRCAPAGSAAPSCTEQAHRALAARLARNAGVSCRVPVPNATGTAVCLDAEGVDLGGLLVAEGLALADPAQSYDYVGAESIARTQHRGLWLFR